MKEVYENQLVNDHSKSLNSLPSPMNYKIKKL